MVAWGRSMVCLKIPNGSLRSRDKIAAGIHVKGGTILKTTNKDNPIKFPVPQPDGTITFADRSDELVRRITALNFDAVINIGGDGSQKISKVLHDKGVPIIGVPKTIDNDLSATDTTFGFQTAVQIATDSFDKLVTTAESHHRVMIMEVMGRDAGWIALHTAIAGGAEICLIPEIPYDVNKLVRRIGLRYKKGRGFANIVIAEGAKPIEGTITSVPGEKGSEHVRLGGVAFQLSKQLKDAGCRRRNKRDGAWARSTRRKPTSLRPDTGYLVRCESLRDDPCKSIWSHGFF